MLYVMNIAKLVLPLISLPYLMRVLSKDCYGSVTFVKSVMQYMQIFVDFGFMLSASKDIVNAKSDQKKINIIIGEIILAKIYLIVISFLALALLVIFIPLLRKYILYTFLSFLVVALTCFTMDFLFKGIEEMQVITYRFVIMRLIATVLAFVFVKSDSDMLWIPILDIIGSLISIILIVIEMRKRKFFIVFSGLKQSFIKLKESGVYFLSNMATTAFTALNTLLTGIILSPSQVADWGVCLQIVTAIQSLYTPITDSIYPQMIKTKSYKLIKRIICIFMPFVICGCILMFFCSRFVLTLLGGDKYIDAVPIMRCLIPVLLFSFPALLFGWPTLGSINKAKEVTVTTIVSALVQIVGLFILILLGMFTPVNIALLRGGVELILFASRYIVFYKNRQLFYMSN